MKITFDAITKSDENYLHRCILGSIPRKVLIAAIDRGEGTLDIKLVIDGVEVDPSVLDDLITNIEKYIEEAGKKFAEERLKGVFEKMYSLEEVIQDATRQIRIEHNLEDA